MKFYPNFWGSYITRRKPNKERPVLISTYIKIVSSKPFLPLTPETNLIFLSNDSLKPGPQQLAQ